MSNYSGLGGTSFRSTAERDFHTAIYKQLYNDPYLSMHSEGRTYIQWAIEPHGTRHTANWVGAAAAVGIDFAEVRPAVVVYLQSCLGGTDPAEIEALTMTEAEALHARHSKYRWGRVLEALREAAESDPASLTAGAPSDAATNALAATVAGLRARVAKLEQRVGAMEGTISHLMSQ